MKYIVVYIILILGLTSLNSAAQKPTIGLLPKTSERIHPEAMIDTCIIHDSLVLFDSLSPVRDTLRKDLAMLEFAGDDLPAFRKRTFIPGVVIRTGLYPLFFKKINHMIFKIYLTALKF
ncbi:MAG: hypothetical protein GY790_06950 [Bacteroidetes bacterium]|nr:hypothetical protein [Bacteroidota bacterium]